MPFNPYTVPIPGQLPAGGGVGASGPLPGSVPPSMPTAPAYVGGFGGPMAGSTPLSAPAAVGQEQLSALAPPRGSNRPSRKFRQGAVSPLWHMLATAVLFAASFVTGALYASDQVDQVYGISTGDGYSSWNVSPWGYVYLLLWFLTSVMATWWITQIGENTGDFGLGLVVIVMWPVWMILLAFVPVLLLLGYLVYLLWPVRLLIVGIWSAANLPRPVAFAIWAAPIISGGLLILAAAVVESSETGSTGAGAADAVAVVLSAITWLGFAAWFLGPFVVSIIQHLGIYKDRENLARRAPVPR